jgi:transcriptional regulator with XRE-family HTH domain
MKIDAQLTDDVVLREIGSRLAQTRLAKNLTQARLATEAGISKRTVERLESGAVAAQLSAFLRVCRVLGLLGHFEQLLPEIPPSPIAQLKARGRERRRASGGPAPSGRIAEPGQTPWTWGENS